MLNKIKQIIQNPSVIRRIRRYSKIHLEHLVKFLASNEGQEVDVGLGIIASGISTYYSVKGGSVPRSR
jgi:hypothetical protein